MEVAYLWPRWLSENYHLRCGFVQSCFFRADAAWDPVVRASAACAWAAGRKVEPPPPPSRPGARNVLCESPPAPPGACD
jgi:hypothetical protein